MGSDLKYGRVTTERGDIPDDEPVFIIRGQDRLAIPVIANYGLFAAVAGCEPEHMDAVDAAIDAVTEWQNANPTKVPDTAPAAEPDGYTPDGWDRADDPEDQAATDG